MNQCPVCPFIYLHPSLCPCTGHGCLNNSLFVSESTDHALRVTALWCMADHIRWAGRCERPQPMRWSRKARNVFFVITKIMGAVLCGGVAWYLYKKGNHLLEQGDVSHTLQIPAYPGAYVLAFCFAVESFILLLQILKLFLEEAKNE